MWNLVLFLLNVLNHRNSNLHCCIHKLAIAFVSKLFRIKLQQMQNTHAAKLVKNHSSIKQSKKS